MNRMPSRAAQVTATGLLAIFATAAAAETTAQTRPAAVKEASSAAKADPSSQGQPGKDFEIKAGKPFTKTFEGERHLRDIRQLTFGGENAEAYFSPDGRKLIYQYTPADGGCDQQYVIDLATGESRLVSSGKGRTTCGYFEWPEGKRIIYASTEASDPECPPAPDQSQGYVWALYDSYELWEANADGTDPKRLTDSPGYDAEATWCHRGGKFVFTSTRDGDLELYTMDGAGKTQRLTSAPGYDGGAFFSPDCSEIVWRASRPEGEELADYKRLLAKGLVRPSALDIYVMKADGTGARRLTDNGAANFCPAFSPDSSHIIWSSNLGSDKGREFDLWMMPKAGGEPERITYAEGFDGFPLFSPDGKLFVWCSNRADPASRETNVFIARWVD